MPTLKPRNPHAPAIQLQDRDYDVLRALYTCDGLLTKDQIARWFYADVDVSQCNRRMRGLFDHKYVDELQDARGAIIYRLARRGYVTLGEQFPTTMTITEADLSRAKKPLTDKTPHHLKINDVRIAFERSAKANGITLAHWISDRVFRTSKQAIEYEAADGKPEKKRFEPDGFCQLHRVSQVRPGKLEAFNYVIEVDNRTHPQRRIANEKIRAGVAYIFSEVYEKQCNTKFGRLLFITGGEARMNHVRALTRQAGENAVKLFFFTTLDLLKAHETRAFDAPIWYVADKDAPLSLLPARSSMPLEPAKLIYP